MLPVQPTGPAISLELDVDDGEVENYEVCFFVFVCPLYFFWLYVCLMQSLIFLLLLMSPPPKKRPSWTSLSVSEKPSSEDWPRETLNSFLPIGSIQITISLNKHCECCPTTIKPSVLELFFFVVAPQNHQNYGLLWMYCFSDRFVLHIFFSICCKQQKQNQILFLRCGHFGKILLDVQISVLLQVCGVYERFWVPPTAASPAV